MKKLLVLCLILNSVHLESMFNNPVFVQEAFNAVTEIPTDTNLSLEKLDFGKAQIAALIIKCGKYPNKENLTKAETVKDSLPKTFEVFQAAQVLNQYKTEQDLGELMKRDSEHALAEVKKIFGAKELIEKYLE